MSLTRGASLVYSAPHQLTCYWNSRMPVWGGTIAAGATFTLVLADDQGVQAFMPDYLAGAGDPYSGAYQGDFLAAWEGTARVPGWWADFNVWTAEQATFWVWGAPVDDQRDRGVGIQEWLGGIPSRPHWGPTSTASSILLDSWLLPGGIYVSRGHLWITVKEYFWQIRNDGLVAMEWAVEMKAKAGV